MGTSSENRMNPTSGGTGDPLPGAADSNGGAESPDGFFNRLNLQFLIHELKDPIAVIETGTRALLERRDKYGPISERQERTLNRILRNVRKTRTMLYDLLEVGRAESGVRFCGRFHPVPAVQSALIDALEILSTGIPDAVREGGDPAAFHALLSDRHIELDVASELGGCEIVQDETKFRQIVGNLIKNGLHHRTRKLVVRMAMRDDRLCVDVTDDGPGVAPEHHRLIFERYAQVDDCRIVERKGHGLGLAGALASARCLGGDIRITSTKGRGATFHLCLPCTADRS